MSKHKREIDKYSHKEKIIRQMTIATKWLGSMFETTLGVTRAVG